MQEIKRALRKEVKARLKSVPADRLASQSSEICSQVLAWQPYIEAERVGLYLSCAKLREVDTTRLVEDALRSGKRVYVPLIDDKESNMSYLHLDSLDGLHTTPPFGILEPSRTYSDGQPRENVLSSSSGLDLLLMPGLAFDSKGGRLGRGGGYYDAFVTKLAARCQQLQLTKPPLVALAFAEQMLEDVPMGQHDFPIDYLATSEGVNNVQR